MMVSMVTVVLSVVALIIYIVDMSKHTDEPCLDTMYDSCNNKHFASVSVIFTPCSCAVFLCLLFLSYLLIFFVVSLVVPHLLILLGFYVHLSVMLL